MIDPFTSLAFSVYSGKGVYALLLGSGISRAAEIPTGWEVTLDLVRKLAAVEGEDCGPSPESWYRKRFGTEPDYSALLGSLAITPSERTNMRAAYFEASAEERELGKKTPTVAHKSIARLASKGYFKVIVTTNFDRLMEQALEAEGISPTVISTADAARGAMPLTHAQCTVIKVHGDYRDTRLRNTSAELSEYPNEINSVLDRVFDEYGLVVCGWSATWDRALCNAMLRSPNRRFSTFWGLRSAPSVTAADLIRFRHASTLEIESADSLFSTVEQKIEALERFNAPHPLSTPIAVASLKRFLTEDRFRIELRDLVLSEVERQMTALAALPVHFAHASKGTLEAQFFTRLELYESRMEMLIPLLAHGCLYGTPAQATIWQDAILRMVSFPPYSAGHDQLINLRRYPATMLMYAGGIAAVASQNYDTLRVILRDARTHGPIDPVRQDTELVFLTVPGQVVDNDVLNEGSAQRWKTPANDRLHDILRNHLRSLIPDDNEYEQVFDRFEYFFTLVYFDLKSLKQDSAPWWAPVGRFTWRGRDAWPSRSHVSEILAAENDAKQESWGPIREGLFTSSARFKEVNDSYSTSILARISNY